MPGTAMGKGGALTVDFHEPAIINNQDKFKGGPTNPQNLNRYSYVLNNPLKSTDPSGHDEESEAYLAGGGYPMTEGGGGEVIGDRYVASAYAYSAPYEDFAETFAFQASRPTGSYDGVIPRYQSVSPERLLQVNQAVASFFNALGKTL